MASNHFRKCFSVNAGVWLRMENKFSGNYIQLTGCFEGFDPEMVWSENFHFKPFLDSRGEREREREPSTLTSPIYEPIDLRTDHAFDFANFADHAFDFTNFSDHAFNFADQRTNLWTHEPIFDPRTFNFAGDLEPSRHEPIFDPEPRTHEPISFSMWFWSTHKPMSLWSLIFFFLLLWWCGWWCFDGFPIVWWWVLCGWWWKIAFLECYQTHENIF